MWRKFNFFDLKKGVDGGKLSELFKDADLTCTTTGNNHLVLGDSSGAIHIVSRNWKATTFRAHDVSIELAAQLRGSPLLVTVGTDEQGPSNPLLKVWDTGRTEKGGTPYCHRVARASPGNRPAKATAICVHEGMQLLALGFQDGSVVLYRGDITREKSSKKKVLRDANSEITGIAFKVSSTAAFLFVATEVSVFVYNITHKDKEQKISLENFGCAKKCSVLAESIQDGHFMIALDNAIYCYTSDGRGPCFAVDGKKVMLDWFRSYLIIISKPNKITTSTELTPTPTDGNTITVFDIHNKFIVFTSTIEGVKAVLSEWGSFYIIDNNYNVYHLDEKDLQSKLSLLFKKNLYDVAIRIAKSQQYDSDGLVDIFKQYGDHLYSKGDHASAVEQYIKTIGKLEPSYVIRKFLDTQHIEKLTTYLQALHKQGQATEDHTTLLLNCYTKLNNAVGQNDSLKEFILSKDKDLDFDVDVAIKVCRQGSPEEALTLAKKYQKHDSYIKLLIEDHQKYKEVVEYIASLDFENAEHYMRTYGNILIQHAPHESTQFLKILCTNYRATGDSNDKLSPLPQKSDPEDYIHLFLNNSERLVEFLEHLIAEGRTLSTPVYDTLLEHYLHIWETAENESEKARYASKTLKLLQYPDLKYDKPQALVVCHMHAFSEGVLYLYEEQKLYQQILRYHMSNGDHSAALACCRRFGHQEPTLWVQALWLCISETKSPPQELLSEVLAVIAKEHLLSPQLVIEAIGTGNAQINLGHIRSYITNELQQEHKTISDMTELTEKYRRDTEKLKEQLETLESGAVLIQVSRCAVCNHALELPSLHFLCQHSYHQHCFQTYAENENECPACIQENKDLKELLRAFDHNKDLHETFHSQLERATDGFTVAAEYFGRGVFENYKVIRETAIDKTILSAAAAPEIKVEKTQKPIEIPPLNYGPGAEAKIRQTEQIRSKPLPQPTSEGRMRLQDPRGRREKPSATVVAKSVPKNPFESDYDDDKNPFKDDEEEEFDEKNPFGKGYCDKNLNPFED